MQQAHGNCGGIEAERAKLADFQKRIAAGLQGQARTGVPCGTVPCDEVDDHSPAE